MNPSSEPIIDGHIHALPRGEMCGGEVDARLQTVLAGLHRHGIRRAVLMPINDIAWQPVDEMNDFAEGVVATNPDLVGFIDIDLSRIHYARGIRVLEDDIIRRHSHGLRGIKVHPQNLGMNADDWRLLPVYRLAGEIGIPVTIHCHPGSEPGTIENSHPAFIEKVVRVFHRTTFIIAHLGGILYFPYMPWLCHENVYYDTSGILPHLTRYFAPEQIGYILEQIGYERILFGSDFPTEELAPQIQCLQSLVPLDRQQQVFRDNILTVARRFSWWEADR